MNHGRCIAFCLLMMAPATLIFQPACAIAAEGDATGTVDLKRTTDGERLRLDYATEYYLLVSLPRSLALDRITAAGRFEVTDTRTGKAIPVAKATQASLESWSESDSASVYSMARLWGHYEPAASYRVVVHNPDGSVGQLTSGPLESATPASLLELVSRRLTLAVDPSQVADSTEIRVQYDARFLMAPCWSGPRAAQRLDLMLKSGGTLTTSQKSDTSQHTLTNGLSLDYRYHWEAAVALPATSTEPAERRALAYPMGISLRPAELESNQAFTRNDYTAKLLLALSVPYVDWPVLWWNRVQNVARPFFPAVITSGYAFVKGLTGDSEGDRAQSNRWDTQALYAFPFSDRLDLIASWQAFVDLKTKATNRFADLSAKYYIDAARKTAVKFSYQKGSLPPDFKKTESVSAGLSMSFL